MSRLHPYTKTEQSRRGHTKPHRALLLASLLPLIAFSSCKKPLEDPSVMFAPPVAYATGGNGPSCVQAADFNGDGKIDLVVANATSGTIAVLLGNGDGTFQTAVTYPVNATGAQPTALAVADLNGDGKPDIVAVNSASPGGQASVSVFLNEGNGTFATPSVIPTPASGQSIAVGDINNDGTQDLWIGASPKSFVMFGNGNGTFQTAISLATAPSGTGGALGVAIGDVNNDGKPDLLATNFSQNNVGILLNTGNGTFAAPTTVPTQTGPAGLLVVDFDQDGNLDIVVPNLTYNAGTVRFGAGDGTFAKHVFVTAGSGPVSAAVGNFSAPNSGDLIFADTGGPGVTFVTGDGGGNFGEPYMFPTSVSSAAKPTFAVVADLDGDGTPDVAVVNFNENNVAILLTEKP